MWHLYYSQSTLIVLLWDIEEPLAYYAIYTKKELEAVFAKEKNNNYQDDSIVLKLKIFENWWIVRKRYWRIFKKLLYEEEGHEENLGGR